ncbi:hypothetical protein KORDIASMS9_03193 [Kordia sp. SMS9]|uniref:hypothetical protein n=1 Tax=Kordia sp. SMS9 TaxID=2282170 RepID=UPI000E0D5BC2|nr:hypothetical protein [Kordia sp. SMS9]AXG70938.1 hypothetical protein KORDIASMS9_03193 [Kordia sp. SMS9]
MKKLSFVLIVLIATTLFLSCQQSKRLSKSEDVGPYVVHLLKNFENTSLEDFKNKLLTLEEIKAYGKKYADTLSQETIKSIESIKKENYENLTNKAYNDIKAGGEKYNIDWNAITFYQFDFKERTADGLTGIGGELLFTFKDTIYEVRTTALKLENKYIPVIANRLKQKEPTE